MLSLHLLTHFIVLLCLKVAKILVTHLIVKLMLILSSKALTTFLTAMPALWGIPPLAMRDSRLIRERSLIGNHTPSQTHTSSTPLPTVADGPSFVEFSVLNLVDLRGPVVVETVDFVILIKVCGNLPLLGVGIIPPKFCFQGLLLITF